MTDNARIRVEPLEWRDKALEEAERALQGLLRHSCIGDVSDRDKFPEDIQAETQARVTLTLIEEARNDEHSDIFRQNMREQYEAFVAMRNDINELIGDMISLEATLKDGPTMAAECQAVVEAVAKFKNGLIAQHIAAPCSQPHKSRRQQS